MPTKTCAKTPTQRAQIVTAQSTKYGKKKTNLQCNDNYGRRMQPAYAPLNAYNKKRNARNAIRTGMNGEVTNKANGLM